MTPALATGHGSVVNDGLTAEEREQIADHYKAQHRPTARDQRAFADWLKRRRGA